MCTEESHFDIMDHIFVHNATTNNLLINMWCDLWKPVTCRKKWNCKIKEINITILMFFFIFYGLWTCVTFDSSIRGDPSKKFWKENNSNFYMIPITQNINLATCDRFSQITSHTIFLFFFCFFFQDTTSIKALHFLGAALIFLPGVIYAAAHTVISYKLYPEHNSRTVCFVRLCVTIVTMVAVLLCILLLCQWLL